MPITRLSTGVFLVALLCGAGCTHLPWRPAPPEYGRRPPVQAYESERPVGSESDASLEAMAGTDRETMLEVLDELQSMGGLTPDERTLLMADLRRTKPSLWPAMVQQFRAALAFRQQLLERDAADVATADHTRPGPASLSQATSRTTSEAVQRVAHEAAITRPTRPRATPLDVPAPIDAVAGRTPGPLTQPTNASVRPPPAVAVDGPPSHQAVPPSHPSVVPASSGSAPVAVDAGRARHLPDSPPLALVGAALNSAAPPRPIPGSQARLEGEQPNVTTANPAEPKRDKVHQAVGQYPLGPTGTALSVDSSAVTLPGGPGAETNHAGEQDWHAQLTTVIQNLERETNASPQTGLEVNRHAALRILYLIAGRRQDALRPIPGVAPALQDFWSKQLYGLATYLDSSGQPDSSRRATVAKQYLCDAASRLGDLGLLTVQNMALCTEVSSFGVFRAFDRQEFTPGQEALLYAEVNNFRSDETEKGFRTAIRSSYQILDASGNRVAHREFAVTEDLCRSRRRDFFMRYFIRLPEQIAPGSYSLELTIEDTLANKIGQSSLPLAIKTTATDAALPR